MDSGRRETSLGRPAGSRPPAPLSPPQDRALLCPALGRARRSRGRKRKASCAFLFFNRVHRSKKKKSPKTSPGPAAVPATHLRAVPGGGGAHARPEFPTPRSALPSPGGGGCSGEPTGEAALFPPRGRRRTGPRARARNTSPPPRPRGPALGGGAGKQAVPPGRWRAGRAAPRGPTRGRSASRPPACPAGASGLARPWAPVPARTAPAAR